MGAARSEVGGYGTSRAACGKEEQRKRERWGEETAGGIEGGKGGKILHVKRRGG